MEFQQPVLIDMTPYLPKEGTILGAVDEAEAQQQEEAAAARDADGIREMIAAPLPAGAVERWAAAMGRPPAVTATAGHLTGLCPDACGTLTKSRRRCILASGHADACSPEALPHPATGPEPVHELDRAGRHGRTLCTGELRAEVQFGATDPEMVDCPACIAAREQAKAAVPGPWGVFEEGLCIAAVEDRETADMLAAEAIAADDGDSEVVVLPLCVEHIDAEQPRDTCEECATDGDAEDDDQADAEEPEVDVDALALSPMIRRMLADLHGRRWHYQTRKKAFDLGLTADVEATALTPYGETVRAALAG